MTAHTPGPWVVHKRPAEPIQNGHHVTTNDGLTVCNVSYQLPDKDGESTRIANARLIAAAPELLEALIRALPTVEHMYHTNPDPDGSLWDDVFVCRAAIAKATGKQA